MKSFVVSVLLSAVLALPAWAGAGAPDVEVGQVWTIHDAPSDQTRLTITLIEKMPDGRTVVHASVEGIGTGVSAFGFEFIGEILHMPFSLESIEKSLDELVRSNAPIKAEFLAGHATWLADEGGIYTITVSEAIDVTLETLQVETSGDPV
jgi:hypothetical protein